MRAMRGWVLSPLPLVVALALLGGGCAYQVGLTAAPHQAESTKILAADGTLVTTLHAEQDREHVALEAIAPVLRKAVVAIEDARFFEHRGIDLRALLRAARRNAQAGEVVEGGSTITQQYVKNVLLDPRQTLHRKAREAVLAFELERRHTKATILERYLNTIYLGNGAYGVEAAAQLYFGKHASDVALHEAALLAGLIQAPERYDPLSAPDVARGRRSVVLRRMRELGAVSGAEAGVADAGPLGVRARPAAVSERYPAAYFVERVKRLVLDDPRFGTTSEERRRLLFEGGLRIRTTVDLGLQQQAEAAVAGVLPRADTDPSAAVVVVDPGNGYVRALVGGRDFFGAGPRAKFDLATQGLRQTGSAFKPFVLTAALEAGVSPDQVFDAPASLAVPIPGQPPWAVENYEDEAGGRMSLADATVHSINTVYAQLVLQVGPERAVEVARALGVRSPLRPFPSAVLGTNEVTVLDMASAYSALAADGMHGEPVLVTEIRRRDGSVLYRRPATRRRVLPAEVARRVNAVLGQVVARGTGTRAQLGRPVAGKTGTAQQWRDAWFVGYTPELVAAVWVGFADRQRSMAPPATPIKVTGGSWPAEIWRRTMEAALAEVPPSDFPVPPEAAPAPPPAPAIVPPVGGLLEAEAGARLVAAGYQPRVERRPSRQLPAGTVLDQTPPPGALAGPGSPVTVVVSSGTPRTVLVPRLGGRTADEAAAALTRAGLVAEVVVEEPPTGVWSQPGRVWKQSPPPGNGVDEGQPVTLWVRR
jgi:penicillin-binding protein 1A